MNKKLIMEIHKIKSIKDFHMELPTSKGLYAITGQNGSGKSTVVTCASSVFFNMKMNDYFGKTDDDASISFEMEGAKRAWTKDHGKWRKETNGIMNIKGFYEGSIIFGNRFRNTSWELLRKLDYIDDTKLKIAPEFIRRNLGMILHNNEEFYTKLLSLNNSDAGRDVWFSGDIFYYQKQNRVSQFHMSTGENLLISILNSINIRNMDRASLNKPCLLFLDEIELALHPSSLKRLIVFLKKMSDEFNYAIYFSTHSIELISGISPENIFFLERHADDSLEALNPCYPAYATRILYDHTGYDHVILVEDDLAKDIIKRLLKKYSLLTNRLVHVLPCGGFTNVIDLADEVVKSNLLGKTANVIIILDKDVKAQSEKYKIKYGISNNIPLNYLPVQSLEKYLKNKLVDNVDHKLFRRLNDYIFHQISLTQLVDDYINSGEISKDSNGKCFYRRIDAELKERNIERSELIELIVDYLIENEHDNVSKIINFLKTQLNDI